MNLREILNLKGTTVHSIGPHASLVEAAERLYDRHCGSLLVLEPHGNGKQAVVGIITERDLLRAAAENRGTLMGLHVSQFMSTMLVTGSPNDTIDETMGTMTRKRIRHLPVMQGDELCGVISIGDVVKAHHDAMIMENHYLKSYIQSV